VTISIRDQNDNIWVPTSASAWVNDSNGTIVQAEDVAEVSSNTATLVITTDVTITSGTYEIVWKLSKASNTVPYIYYHKTQLTVEEI
jgi:hypothetical protein